jgi:DNA-binding NarL/FixJ family response regulator
VDDHAIVRAGLRLLIAKNPGIVVVGEAASLTEAVSTAARTQPDIILLDLIMGGEDGLDYLATLHSASKNSRLIILTGALDPNLHHRAVQLGALGVVLKDKAPEVLIKAIERVNAGEVWLDPTSIATILGEMTNPSKGGTIRSEGEKIASLTARERQVVALVLQGLRNREIADRLSVSPITIRHHLSSIFGKLEVSDRFELIIYSYDHGLRGPSKS